MIEIKRKTVEEIDAELRQILEAETYIDKRDDNSFGYEIFVNYDEELGDNSLAKITRSEDPAMELEEILEEWRFNSEDYYRKELKDTIEKHFEDYDSYEDEINEWINENVYWYLPEKVYDQDVDVVVSLDVGDMNYDFTRCNILNWYGTVDLEEGEAPEIPEDSPIRWLAERQGNLKELEYAITCDVNQSTDINNGEYVEFSKITRTMIQEMQNACSHMNTLIFLCKVTLEDFIKMKEMVKSDEDLNKSYYYDERKGEKTFTITKEAMCGLYDIWGGGGSVLEIELDKDVVIPTKAIFDIWIDCRGSKANGRGYDVTDVYGMDSSAFTGEVKEIAT